jgi:mediator of RNA polymerase II transcription subunit 12
MERLELPVIDETEAGESLAHALLSVMEATAFSISNVSPTLSSTLVDRLSRLLQAISLQEETAKADANSTELWRHTPDNTSQIQCWILLFLRIATLHRPTFSPTKTSISDQGRMLVGFCALLQTSLVQSDEALHRFVFDIASTYADEMAEDTRNQIRRFVKGRGLSDLLGYLVGSAEGVNGGETLKAVQKGRLVEFPVKQWERIAEPTTQSGDNDTSLNMVLFGTTKVRCGSAGAL